MNKHTDTTTTVNYEIHGYMSIGTSHSTHSRHNMTLAEARVALVEVSAWHAVNDERNGWTEPTFRFEIVKVTKSVSVTQETVS